VGVVKYNISIVSKNAVQLTKHSTEFRFNAFQERNKHAYIYFNQQDTS